MKKYLILLLCISLLISFPFYIKAKEKGLFGKVIFLDAGHGGKDNGASSDSVLEDEINLKITSYLANYLLESDAKVLMSRVNDYDLASLYSKNRKREDLNKRVNYINESKPDLLISIHLNIYKDSSVSGAQVFYKDNDNSRILSELMQNNFNELCNKDKKSKNGNDYYILKNVDCDAILIECGFLSNLEERNKLAEETYQKKIALLIKDTLVNYFN